VPLETATAAVFDAVHGCVGMLDERGHIVTAMSRSLLNAAG